MGFYCPQMYPVGPRPNRKNWQKLGMQDVMYGLREGPDGTNDLTKSFIRFFFS